MTTYFATAPLVGIIFEVLRIPPSSQKRYSFITFSMSKYVKIKVYYIAIVRIPYMVRHTLVRIV